MQNARHLSSNSWPPKVADEDPRPWQAVDLKAALANAGVKIASSLEAEIMADPQIMSSVVHAIDIFEREGRAGIDRRIIDGSDRAAFMGARVLIATGFFCHEWQSRLPGVWQNALHLLACHGVEVPQSGGAATISLRERFDLLRQTYAALPPLPSKSLPPLCVAAAAANLEAIDALMDLGADPKSADARGLDALHTAIESDQSRSVRRLLARGADPNALDRAGLSALHRAVCSTKRLATASCLLASPGIEVNVAGPGGFRPLHFAAAALNLPMVRLLLAHPDIDADARDCLGRSTLDLLNRI